MQNYACVSDVPVQAKSRLLVSLYMMLSGIKTTEALNCAAKSDGQAGSDIGEKLKMTLNRWKADGFNIETGKVDYQRLANSEVFSEFRDAVSILQNFDPATLQTENERKAFWINMYNMLIVHGIIAYGVKSSVQEVKGAFERFAYIIGGYRFSTDDIEHGILRANKGHVAMPGKRFSGSDSRRRLVVETLDPRIHFTLVCASTSCPPIGIYQADLLDLQFDLAAKNFINNGGVVVDRGQMTVSLSRIFQWYASDFGGSWMNLFGSVAPVLRWIAQFIQDSDLAQFVDENAEKLQIRYQEYDWSLNV